MNGSPVVQRRSRKIAAADQIVEEVPPEEFNDDEEERSQLRKQVENDLKNNSTNDKRLSISEKSISEHYRSCIQLAAENKITVKNAFNFKLIDLLHNMLSKKRTIKDFTEVTTSLDAGVKIYSCRVDNVHSDTMKMATSMNTVSYKNESLDVDDEGEGDAEKAAKKIRRKIVKKTMLAQNLDLINRHAGNDFENDVRNPLSSETFIINSAVFDNNRVCWHLNTSRNFWQDNLQSASTNDSEKIMIELPNLPENAAICKTFETFRFGEESVFPESTLKEQITNAYDFESSASISIASETMTADPLMDDAFNYLRSSSEASQKTDVGYLSRIMSSSEFIVDISRLLASEKSDYFYFNSQSLKKNWNVKNMRHWNPFKKKKQPEEKRTKTEKQVAIDFNDTGKLKILDEKSDSSTAITTVASREKFLITPITHFSVKEFFRLKVWHQMFVIPTSSSNEEEPSDLDENINDYDYNNPNDSQHFIPETYEDDYREEDNTANDIHEAIAQNAFVGDNLVEIPNKISKIQLPYMAKDKSVNMKNLKLKIWTKIESPYQLIEKENDEIKFTRVCQSILIEGKKTTEELTIPILFNAILQLANDKSLFLQGICENNLTDFTIKTSTYD